MKKKEVKGLTAFRDGYRLNRTVTLRDGSKTRLYTGKVSSLEEGEAELKRLIDERNAELLAEEERRLGICPLGEYLENYLKKLPDKICKKTGRSYSPSTVVRKRDLYECQIKGSALSGKKITEIKRRDIEIFKMELEDKKKSNNRRKSLNNNTRNKVITLLKEVFADFYRTSEHPENNPMVGVERYTESNPPKTMDNFLNDEEILKLMKLDKEYFENPRPRTNDRVYSELIDLSILLHTRPGELIALKAKDYDRKTGEIKIRRTLSLHKIGEEGKAKTAQSIRAINLNERDRMIIERNLIGKKQDDLIFTGVNGGIISESDLNRTFKRRLSECGIEKALTMYSTRGTGITFALSHGADPAGVAGISGHSQKTMYQHYAAITATQKKQAAEATAKAYDELLNSV